MLAPLLGVMMMAALATILFKLTHNEIENLERLHEEGFKRALAITSLSDRLAVNHARVYELLGKVDGNTDEGAFYDSGKPLLHAIHQINADLRAEMASLDSLSREALQMSMLVKSIETYRVTTTNAMLMATVDRSLSLRVMSESTGMFNQLNAAFLSMNELTYAHLNRQLSEHRASASQQTQLFAALFIVAIVVMLGVGGLLANVLSRDLNQLVSRLGHLVSWNVTPGAAVSEDEVATLTVAIERVRESYESLDHAREELDVTNKQLSESHETIRERERALEELNAALQKQVATQEAIIEKQRIAEIARDRALEEAERASNVKSEFLATMSHELRTPLNAIIGFSEMILNATFGPIRGKYQEYAEYIHMSGEHLLRLISNVLDISRIEGGQLQLDLTDVEVGEVFSSCKTLMGSRADVAQVDLVFEQQDDLPLIHVDRVRLKQVLLNLIDNAVKFTSRGGRITVAAEMDGPQGVLLTVRDTGIGIAKEDIPKALEKFGQVRGEIFHSHEGAGIGLSLSKSLVNALGGTLVIESEVGKGTTVFVRFPRVRSADAPGGAGAENG